MAEGVAELVRRVEVEALFADGSRLLVLHDPIGASGPPPQRGGRDRVARAGPRADASSTRARSPVGVTSHFHFFEVNRALRFDRAAAWGMRLAIAPGAKVFFDPGVPQEVFLVPFGGARVIRGHAGLADGPLDAEGAREAALALARERGYRGA